MWRGSFINLQINASNSGSSAGQNKASNGIDRIRKSKANDQQAINDRLSKSRKTLNTEPVRAVFGTVQLYNGMQGNLKNRFRYTGHTVG